MAAASLADSGDLQGAISMLATAGASKALRNPSNRHVRQWYLLGDLYERAGDVPRAREMFERVLKVDREAYDVVDRLAGLGAERKPRSPSAPEAEGRPSSLARFRSFARAPSPVPSRPGPWTDGATRPDLHGDQGPDRA